MGFKCHSCMTPLSPKITVSDGNGNKGKHYITVHLLLSYDGSLLTNCDI